MVTTANWMMGFGLHYSLSIIIHLYYSYYKTKLMNSEDKSHIVISRLAIR